MGAQVMATAKKTADSVTMEQALTELNDARTNVENAQKALTEAENTRAEKVEQIKGLFDDLKENAKELGLEITANVEEAAAAIDQKLDEAKAEWATTAATNPNEARRQIRAIWAVIGTVAGLVVGFAAGYLYCYLG